MEISRVLTRKKSEKTGKAETKQHKTRAVIFRATFSLTYCKEIGIVINPLKIDTKLQLPCTVAFKY
jgi:hypothetical protein